MASYHKTPHGQIILGDSLDHMAALKSASVDLIVTSPPFGLLRKKDYGNVESGEYIEWLKPFGREFKRLLKSSGSLVIDIGGAWLLEHVRAVTRGSGRARLQPCRPEPMRTRALAPEGLPMFECETFTNRRSETIV
jgi:predicted methyltransferase